MRLLICLAILVAPAFAYSQDTWLCVEDLSTGFAVNKNTGCWDIARFLPADKYLISPMGEGDFGHDIQVPPEITQYKVTRFGDNSSSFRCTFGFHFHFSGAGMSDMSSYSAMDQLNCDGLGQFRFNRKTLRFLYTYVPGYIALDEDGSEDTSNTPSINIGTCSKL